MIKQIIEKMFCKHEWKQHATVYSGSWTQGKLVGEILICNKCGKIRKVFAI